MNLVDRGDASTPAGSFAGPSEMHRRVSALDWGATSVGPVERWPQSLRATIKTLLGSRYPIDGARDFGATDYIKGVVVT